MPIQFSHLACDDRNFHENFQWKTVNWKSNFLGYFQRKFFKIQYYSNSDLFFLFNVLLNSNDLRTVHRFFMGFIGYNYYVILVEQVSAYQMTNSRSNNRISFQLVRLNFSTVWQSLFWFVVGITRRSHKQLCFVIGHIESAL